MGILALAADERVADVEVTEDELTVRLMDGRAISVPLVWYPRLLNATAEQRKNWRISGGGYGIHWEDVDEDLSTEGLLRGIPAARQSSSAMRMFQAEAYTPSDDIQDDQNDQEKGILDYFVEGEEAGSQIVTIILQIGTRIEDISSKIETRTAEINGMGNAVTGAKPSELNTILLLAAADINSFSKNVEEMSAEFERNINIYEKSLSTIISLMQTEDIENLEQLLALRESLSATLEVVRSVKGNIGIFKDTVHAISSQGISSAITRATSRQSKALDTLIASIEEFESFALRIIYQLDNKLGQA